MTGTLDKQAEACVAAVTRDLDFENEALREREWDLGRVRSGYVILASRFEATSRPFGVALIAEPVDLGGPKTFVLDGLKSLLTDLAQEGIGEEAKIGNVRFRFLKRTPAP